MTSNDSTCINTYIQRAIFSGFDWHDIGIERKMITENGQFEISDVTKAIALDCVDYNIPYEKLLNIIQQCLDNPETTFYYDSGMPSEEKIDENTIDCNPVGYSFKSGKQKKKNKFMHVIVSSEFENGYQAKTCYTIAQFPKDDVCYTVDEILINPAKGYPEIIRTCHEAFDSLTEAESYLSQQKKQQPDYSQFGAAENSGFQLFVNSKTDLLHSESYQNDIRLLKLCELLHKDINEYRFWFEPHIDIPRLEQEVIARYKDMEKELAVIHSEIER